MNELDYIKEYIDLGSDEGASLQTQFMLLCNDGDGIRYCQYYGLYRLLLGMASRQARRYRGYLLGPGKEPLTDAQIGQLIHIPAKTMTKMLKQFARLKLMEKLELPDFDTIQDEPSDKSGSRNRPKRNRAQKRAAVRAPSREDKYKYKSNSNSKRNKKYNRPSAPTEGQNQRATGEATEGQQPSKSRPALEPTPPTLPTPSDAGSAVTPTGSPRSVHNDGPVHISGALAQVRRRCNQAALQAGRDIYRALGSPWPDDSAESAREVGAFASCFERAMDSGLGPTVLVDLWQNLTREAARLRKVYAKNGNGYRSAARVFCKKILPGKLAAAAQQRGPPEKAAV